MKTKENFGKFYDKYYLVLALIPLLLVIISLLYIGNFYSVNGDFIFRDTSLSGGTTITLTSPNSLVNLDITESLIKSKVPDSSFKTLSDISTGNNLALIIESSLDPDVLTSLVEEALGYKLTPDNSSVEFSGPSISASFYFELIKVVLLSFILMGLVVFIIFGEGKFIKSLAVLLSVSAIRLTFPISNFLLSFVVIVGLGSLIYSLIKFEKAKLNYFLLIIGLLLFVFSLFYPLYNLIFLIVVLLFITYALNSIPSIAVIFAAFSDLVITIAIIDFMGIKVSAAGLVAFLMLIGYSVDTDILLTNKALRSRGGNLNGRIFEAFKTGSFMTIAALASVLPAFLLVTGLPDSFRQIFLVVSIGLFADLFNTWLTNAGIIKWYCQKRGIN